MLELEPMAPRPMRPPPKPPFFGIKIHPVVMVLFLLALIGIGMLIAFASNPNFLPAYNPFSTVIPSPEGIK